jgi:tripartite-type tricarboxylate transporter receptor subunit TctC
VALLRRQFLSLSGLAATLPIASRIASAQSQSYPARPVRFIVGFAPSGGNDIVARLIAQWLTDRLGQSFLVDNRPGGGSNIGTEAVVNAPADGYTLLLVSAANAINASMFDKLNFNFIRDIAPVGGLMRVPSVILMNPSVPVRTVPEFIVYAKQTVGKLSMGSGGTATSTHLAGELLKMMAGLDMIYVPYRGTGPAITDLLGGQIQVMFGSAPSSVQYIKTGQLRGLAVTSSTRLETLPDIPTVGETVPGYEASQWYGIGVPKATPAPIVELLNKEINAFLADRKMKEKLVGLGGTELPGSPPDFAQLIADETDKWGKVVKFANVKPH